MTGVVVALAVILWVCLRHTGVAIALSFLLAGFVWRLVGAAFLDYTGPVYSYEAEMQVGGNTFAADSFGLLMALSVLVTVVVMRPATWQAEAARLAPLSSPGRSFSLGDLAFGVGLFFVLALYIDLLRIGVIPLLQCIERYEYLQDYAGLFHKVLFKYGSLIALQLGTFAVYPRLVGGRYDGRFILLVAALFVYLSLTGNRFSAFYTFTLFFLTPYCFVWLIRGNSQLANGGGRVRRTWLIWLFLAVGGVAIVGFSLLNSYANIRYENSTCAEVRPTRAVQRDLMFNEMLNRFLTPEVQHRFSQRILVQPIQMYFFAYDRVNDRGDWVPEETARFIFDSKRNNDGNRSIRFLMNRTLPAERAAYLESVGNQFAGGYPEVLLELLGKWGVWPGVIAFAAITGWLLRLWMIAVLRGHFLTAFFAAYVYYAFVVMYVGGMLNFLIAWTFWGKVVLLALFAWLECRGYRLLPWRFDLSVNLAKRH